MLDDVLVQYAIRYLFYMKRLPVILVYFSTDFRPGISYAQNRSNE